MLSLYYSCLYFILYLIDRGKINSICDLDFKTNPKFFFDNVLLYPECFFYCIIQTPVSFNREEYMENKNNFIESCRERFNKNNFNQYKSSLSELLRDVKQKIRNKYKYVWLELEKKTITKGMKRYIYVKEYFDVHGNNDYNQPLKCPCCMSIDITSYIDNQNLNNCKFNFEGGHIKSFYNGGETKVENLRPICRDCNNKMGKKNWA